MPPIDPILPASLNGEDTIVAVSTPLGRGGIGVIRLSGSDARTVADRILVRNGDELRPRYATMARLVDEEGRTVDQAVVTYYAGPRSYTGEDVVEISCHGSPAVLGYAVERAMMAGARLAEPGEFTLRSYKNGRMDLAQAEAVRDLIDSTTVYQARVAMQQIEGALSRRMKPIQSDLRELIALLEAGIDFAEDDIDVAPSEEILRRLDGVREPIRRLAESFRYGKVVREGVTLAILGRPNVGKSSLFNRLLERDRAIVTPQAGTTRDVISEHAEIEGLPVKLLDTAGVRSTSDVIEAQGVERSYEALADADLILVVVDLSEPLDAADHELIERARGRESRLIVGNKCDLPRRAESGLDLLPVSATTGEGVAELRRAIREHAAPAPDSGLEGSFVTSLRQERLLREALEHLDRAEQAVRNAIPHEMLLLDLYSALSPVDAVTGATTVDDILDKIFSTFCIGK